MTSSCSNPSMVKPPRLQPGSRIAVIAPASSAKSERIELGMEALRKLGYEAVEGRHLRGRSPQYFSGTVQERLEDLHHAFGDASIAAIICSRGGYGSNYLLENIDLSLISKNPKPWFGYSDMTVLQNLLLDRTGLVSFHGPMVAADFCREDGVHRPSFDAAVAGGATSVGSAEGLRALRPGHASGTLYGGCLSMIVSALGTPFAAETEGKLLFLEDIGVKPYQVDRMLRQLILAGKLDGVSGIIFGEMLDCASPGADPDLLEAMILRVLDWFEGPIAIGLRSGHVSRDNVTLPFGIQAELKLSVDAGEDKPMLRFLEPAVRN
ncbi:Muramoyltetrapeptide carboxypeptidase [Acidisarcina polymorpha]|uniref:Muramoyltetrapeptide carboxypeptidase n=1 Tax=Acidisarcina polymorpha TaxID=2211140 RepID=A0A2Z5FRW8_9BACT|nr:LD-carboxypeptidase [Acidisarcina polymorpha]AXC09448.1 Muramoyltetrapeptide carboxypeptidase [Acidisarcina polymorpha]